MTWLAILGAVLVHALAYSFTIPDEWTINASMIAAAMILADAVRHLGCGTSWTTSSADVFESEH